MILHGETWPANGHLWTISVEEQFYLAFPFFAWLSKKRLAAALAACVALGPVLRTLLTALFDGPPWDDGLKAFAVMVFAPAHFDAFSLGALLALFRPFFALRLDLARRLFASAFGAAFVYACIYLTVNAASSAFNGEAFRCIYSGILWGAGRQIWVYSTVLDLPRRSLPSSSRAKAGFAVFADCLSSSKSGASHMAAMYTMRRCSCCTTLSSAALVCRP
jgi:peptidoglycan/LPS O-acetylase OafA/YrhL